MLKWNSGTIWWTVTSDAIFYSKCKKLINVFNKELTGDNYDDTQEMYQEIKIS